MKRNRPGLLMLFAATSCAGAPPAAPPGPAVEASPATAASAPASAPPALPGLRLPRTVEPVRYRATLTVVPESDALAGEIDIELKLREPTDFVWLNASALEITKASIEVAGKRLEARAVPGDEDHVGVAFGARAPAGAAVLHLEYRGEVSATDDHGVFREQEGDAFYAFTQFEAIAARRAFPCFDEPSFKVPWQLSLRVKKEHLAVANSPVASETPAEGGMKLVRFVETRPLPSYLIAFAVGPFDLVDAGKVGKKATPVRVVVPRGRAADARYAAESTPALLGLTEEYFGGPYPYEKLDVVSVPKLITFGAMENPGLITFRLARSLASKEQETPSFKQRFAGTMAHELAHQWFGDLVTLDFWDDTWLNESFASWMGDKILARYRPEWPVDTWRVNDAARAMREDGLSSARRIHQPIASKDDIYNAFDSITYVKGQAVLEMFEAWIGPERFQSGVRRYMREHAHANATARDFLAALSAESGDKAGAVVPAFSSFLDRPGVPLVRAELSCDKGKPPVVKLAQERYRPLGTAPDASGPWHIPTCVRYEEGKSEGRACTLLTERAGELPLTGAKSCPDRVILKDGGVGYYRAAYAPGALGSLVAAGGDRLSPAERLSLIRDAEALIDSGRLSMAEGLSLLPRLARDPDPRIVEGAALLASAARAPFLSEAQRPGFARFVQKTFGKQAAALGLSPKAGEDDNAAELRPILVMLVAERGEDKKLIAEAKQRAERWIGEPASLDEDAIDPVLHIAARYGDRALFDRLYAAAKQEKDQKRRAHLLRAMASFHDPAIVKESLAVLLRGEFDPRDAMMLLRQDEEMADVLFSFTQQNYDALLARLPRPALGFLPSAFASMCDEKQRAEVESFFNGRIDKIPGGTRPLAQALEKIGICVAVRAAQRESLEAFLKKNG